MGCVWSSERLPVSHCIESGLYMGLLSGSLVVPVVDAFAISDHILNSPLGRYDGQIYEAYFNQVSSPAYLDATRLTASIWQVRASNPPEKEHPYFNRLIAPLLNRVPEDEEADPESAMGLEEELQEMRDAEQASKKPEIIGKGVGGKGIPAGGGSGAAGVGQVVAA